MPRRRALPPPRLGGLGAALLVVAAIAAGPRARADEPASWATTQAAELTRQGREHAARGEADTATRRYLDAIGFDPTYGPAYLGLGALQEAVGDPREAERAYAMGLDHVAGFAEAHRARAKLRLRLHRVDEAVSDLEAAAGLRPDDLAVLSELGAAYVQEGSLPAALGVTRRIAAVAEAQGDARAGAEARVRARALGLLVGGLDPVAAGISGRGVVRRALALHLRKR